MTSLLKMPGMRLDGRRALVTGGGRGLGVALAAALAEAGAAVTLVARTASDIQQTANAIIADGGIAETLVLDVCDRTAVETALAARSFEILVNNAGTNRPGPFLDASAEDFDTVLDLNLRSVFFVTQVVARRMIGSKTPGSIINISSQMGHVGAANRTIYCASKHALEGFTKALAVELAPKNIRVNAIAPTFIETPMTAPYFENAAFRGEVLGKIKLGRLGRLEDIMGAVVFLASDAAALITGTSLVIDGGWTAE